MPQNSNSKGGKHTLLYRFPAITLLLYLACLLALSCSEGENPLGEGSASEMKKFRPDFTIVTVHKTVESVFRGLHERNITVSGWTEEAISDHLILNRKRETYHIVVLAMSELGFSEDESVSYNAILKGADAIGLKPMTFEVALALREQFLNQPDHSTGDRLSEFIVAIDPLIVGVENSIPKAPVLTRDDRYPDPTTGIGLWILLLELRTGEYDRLFNPDTPFSFGGRFAFLVPDNLNLDLLEE